MAESVEHAFLSDSILAILEDASKSRLYAYKEANRKRFDFACDLATNWQRVVSGQTLWKHHEGIDKDVRMLLSEAESDVLVYVARTTMKNKRLLHEVISDYKKTELATKLERLRVFWVPEDFDADSESHRNLVYSDLRDSVANDLLLTVVLGGITARDVTSFATWSGMVGLSLATLTEVAETGFGNYTSVGKKMGVSAGTIKDRVIRLSLTGFLDESADPAVSGSIYEVSPKGYALLDLCGRLYSGRDKRGTVDSALQYICSLLGVDPRRVNLWSMFPGTDVRSDSDGSVKLQYFTDISSRLAVEIDQAVQQWGTSLPDPHYEIPDIDS